MSLKKYMLIDLLMLGFIGALFEGVGTYAVYMLIAGHMPTMVLSALIVIIAITRWKGYGLILVPFLALGNFIGGQLVPVPDGVLLSNTFTFQYYISGVVGLLGCSVIMIFYKFIGRKKLLSNNLTIVGVCMVVYIAYEILRIGTYWVLGGNNLDVVAAYLFDLMGLAVLIVGSIIVKIQGSLVDVKEKLIEDEQERLLRQQAEMEVLELDDEDISILANDDQKT